MNIISLIMVLVMMFSGIGSLTGSLQAPVGSEAVLTVNADGVDAMMADMSPAAGAEEKEQAGKVSKLIVDLLNGLTCRVVLDKGYLEYSLSKGGETLFSLAGESGSEETAVVTSLLGDTKLTVANETAQQMMTQFMQQMGQSIPGIQVQGSAGGSFNPADLMKDLDMEGLSAAFSEAGQTILTGVMSKFSAPEQGTFTADGMTFPMKSSLNMTKKELTVLVLQAVKDLTAKEAVQKALAKFSPDGSLEKQLDEKLAEAQASTDESAIPVATYVSEDGKNTYVFAELDEGMTLGIGSVDGKALVNVIGGKKASNVSVHVVAAETGTEVTVETPSPTGKMFTGRGVSTGKDGKDVKVTLSYDGKEMLAAENRELTVTKAERLTDAAAEEFKLETLLAQDTAEEAAQKLSAKLTAGVMGLMSKLMMLAGENAALLGQLMGTMPGLGK